MRKAAVLLCRSGISFASANIRWASSRTLPRSLFHRPLIPCCQQWLIKSPAWLEHAGLDRGFGRSKPFSVASSSLSKWQISLADTKMSDHDGDGGAEQKPFCVEYASSGRAGCKKCKQKIEKGALRVGKLAPNPFGEGMMKLWHHPRCMFEVFTKQRASTARINDLETDVDGVDALKPEDVELFKDLIKEFPGTSGSQSAKNSASKKPADSMTTPQKKKGKQEEKTPTLDKFLSPGKKDSGGAGPSKTNDGAGPSGLAPSQEAASTTTSQGSDGGKQHDTLREFRKMCMAISTESAYNGKTAILKDFFTKGPKGKGFQGDILLWVKLLLPAVEKRVYNLKTRQLTKLFAQMLGVDNKELLEEVEKNGDPPNVIAHYFGKSTKLPPSTKSELTLQEVDATLDDLATRTREEDQGSLLKDITAKCTENDLMVFLRMVVHDLRITLGPKHVLDAIHPQAYEAFRSSRNLAEVVKKFSGAAGSGSSLSPGPSTALAVKHHHGAAPMTPVSPMLAEACKSVEHAFKRAPQGMFAEIKYDGERVQVHKKGTTFMYFSRSLKPVVPHKVSHLKDYIPRAFPTGDDMILDAEILLVNTVTGKPLPFGTLGVHKKAQFQEATVCIFVFDLIHFNGENLMKKPLVHRKQLLETHMTEIEHRVMFSEMKLIKNTGELHGMINRAISEGLEGLVLKDPQSLYEPGKRHWMKMKKDYLEEGAMADTADLVVLGAWYGTGYKGGMMSVWLMGCYDEAHQVWKTVTKVHGGIDDKTLAKLQETFKPLMTKINKDPAKVPKWLRASRTMVPDFVVNDPKQSPVWEITGAEFTQNEVHTADGISIRFPRITKFRDDKDYKTATSLEELRILLKNSKTYENTPTKRKSEDGDEGSPFFKKIKLSNETGSPSPSPLKKISKKDLEALFNEPSTSGLSSGRGGTPRKEKNGSMSTPKKDKNGSVSTPKKDKNGSTPGSTPSKSKNGDASWEIPKEKLETRGLHHVFTDMKVYVEADVEQRDTIARYIIAYDGEVIEPHESKAEATHVVCADLKDVDSSVSGEFVPAAWVWDCIKLKKILPMKRYKK